MAKNLGGTNHSRYCSPQNEAVGTPPHHSEAGQLPRRLWVKTPFDASNPGDDFPKKQVAPPMELEYSHGQVAGAALWHVRLGMRSKCRPSGLPQFAVRWRRALGLTGISVHPRRVDAERLRAALGPGQGDGAPVGELGAPGGPKAFAHNGAHTTSKVTAGLARAGIFLIPPQCLDGNPMTLDPACPSGEGGADAVIDIDDNETGDDLTVHGVVHPEHDFLRLGGPAPKFLVRRGRDTAICRAGQGRRSATRGSASRPPPTRPSRRARRSRVPGSR